MDCGVYQIYNVINGHRYIGSSKEIRKRWSVHKRELRGGYHKNQYLKNAWDKYGDENFEFEILLYCDEDMRIWYEQQCLDRLMPVYNIAISAHAPMSGLTLSEDHKRKIGEANKGNLPWNTGKKREKSTCEKISKSRNGIKFSMEHREKLRNARKGKITGESVPSSKLTERDVLDIRDALKGGKSKRELSDKYNVHVSTIYLINQRKTWKYI